MTADVTSLCPACRNAFTPNATGRPALFCSVGCRRAAEMKTRRLQERLTRLENEAETCRRDRSGLIDVMGNTKEQRQQDVAEEIASAERELRLLMGALSPHEP